jgi:hypothetical protein
MSESLAGEHGVPAPFETHGRMATTTTAPQDALTAVPAA